MSFKKLYYILFSLVSIGLIVFSTVYQRNNYEISKCRMTYMYPSYYPISVPSVPAALRRYKLYLYRDGRFDSEETLNGTPLLFIPGNRGSYGQARSLGGVLQEIAFERGQTEQRYDVFSADLNEEFTAFSTQSLEDQAKFINYCIQAILNLYDSTQLKTNPKAVVIVAHSMGGMVIKRSIMLPTYPLESVNTIITLATPHSIPRIPFDSSMVQLYQEVNRFWNVFKYIPKSTIFDTILISISGGVQDLLISDQFAQMDRDYTGKNMHLFSSQIQNTWTSTDHLCILWCNQLVIQLANALTNIHRPYLSGRTILNSLDRINIINSTLLYENVTDITFSNSFHTPILDMNFLFKKQHMPKELRLKPTKSIVLTSNHKFKVFTCKETKDCKTLQVSKLKAIPTTKEKDSYGIINYFTMSIPKLEKSESDLLLIVDSPPKEDPFLFSREAPQQLPSFRFSLLNLITGVNLSLDDSFHTQILLELPYSSIFTYSLTFSHPEIILRLHFTETQETKFVVKEKHALMRPSIPYNRGQMDFLTYGTTRIEADFWNINYQTSPRPSINIKLNWLHTLGILGSKHEIGIIYFPILLLMMVHLRQVQVLNNINAYYGLEQTLKQVLRRPLKLHLIILGITFSKHFLPIGSLIRRSLVLIITLTSNTKLPNSLLLNYWFPFDSFYSFFIPHLLFTIGIGLTWILHWASIATKFILKLALFPFHILLKSRLFQMVNLILLVLLLIAGFSPQLLAFIMYSLAFTSTISNANHSKIFEPIRLVIFLTILVLTPTAATNIWNLVKMGEIWSESGYNSIINIIFLLPPVLLNHQDCFMPFINILRHYLRNTFIMDSVIALSSLFLYQQFWYLHCFTACLILNFLINT